VGVLLPGEESLHPSAQMLLVIEFPVNSQAPSKKMGEIVLRWSGEVPSEDVHTSYITYITLYAEMYIISELLLRLLGTLQCVLRGTGVSVLRR